MKNYIIGFIAVVALAVGVLGFTREIPVVQGPQGEQGVSGLDGYSPSREDLVSLIKPLIPAPIKGDKGESGAIGMPGKLGAVSGPDISSPYLSVNGVETFYYSAGLNKASSTVCAFKTPSATSTLLAQTGVLQVDSGLTGALFFEIGKSTVMDATTTSLGTYAAGSGTKFTMAASTTPVDNVDENWMFAPNTWLVFKTSSTTPAQITGSCQAELRVN